MELLDKTHVIYIHSNWMSAGRAGVALLHCPLRDAPGAEHVAARQAAHVHARAEVRDADHASFVIMRIAQH